MTDKENAKDAVATPLGTVVLIGPTGAGKTAVGSALARLLRRPFTDSDHAIAQQFGSVPALYRERGEAAFRRTEAAVIAALLADHPEPLMLSLGGGAVLDAGTRRLLLGLAVVWLDMDLRSVLPRLQSQADRPLFAGDLAGRWQRNADARNGFYAESATLRIDARTGSPEELAREIRAQLQAVSVP